MPQPLRALRNIAASLWRRKSPAPSLGSATASEAPPRTLDQALREWRAWFEASRSRLYIGVTADQLAVLKRKFASHAESTLEAAQAAQDTAQLSREQITRVMRQITTNWDANTARIMAEANLTSASAEDKGDVFILAPNDITARAIADVFAADREVKSYRITGQDAEQESTQYILAGRQSMTVFKDVRNLVQTTIDTTLALLKGDSPQTGATYNNGAMDVPVIQSPVKSIDKDNVRSVLLEAGYYQSGDPGSGSSPSASPHNPVVGIVLPTSEEPRWVQDKARFQEAFKAAGYEVEILFSQGDAVKEKRTSKPS